MKILVSNLNLCATEMDLERLFAQYGEVSSVKIIRGWDSYESRGLAVVEFHQRETGEKVIQTLNKTDHMEHQIGVSEIRTPYSQVTQNLVTQY